MLPLLVPHHSNQVSTAVLSNQLLLAILLQDDGAQAATQHNKGAVGLLPLPEKGQTDRQADSESVTQQIRQSDSFAWSQGSGDGQVGVVSPVDGSSRLQCHPVEGKVNLADKG